MNSCGVSGSSHIHEVTFTSSNKILVNDLGHNCIYSFNVNSNGLLDYTPTSTTFLSIPSSGPRHLVVHPSQSFVFVINELLNTITSYYFDVNSNSLVYEIQTISTLRSSESNDNMGAAEIILSKDGKYLYGSNRDLSSPNLGRSSIVAYEIDQSSGKLTLLQHISTYGEQPRHFNLFNNDSLLIVGNLKTNSIYTFERNIYTGLINDKPLSSINIDSPTYILSYYH